MKKILNVLLAFLVVTSSVMTMKAETKGTNLNDKITWDVTFDRMGNEDDYINFKEFNMTANWKLTGQDSVKAGDYFTFQVPVDQVDLYTGKSDMSGLGTCYYDSKTGTMTCVFDERAEGQVDFKGGMTIHQSLKESAVPNPGDKIELVYDFDKDVTLIKTLL